MRAASYLFVGENELRNLEEPGWLFEYLQQVLNGNYKFLVEFVCCGVRGEVGSSVAQHFLGGGYAELVGAVVERRLGADLAALNDFLLFHFLDELGKLEDKLLGSFGARAGLVERVLLRFEGARVLQRCLDYEQRWFESKVFEVLARPRRTSPTSTTRASASRTSTPTTSSPTSSRCWSDSRASSRTCSSRPCACASASSTRGKCCRWWRR